MERPIEETVSANDPAAAIVHTPHALNMNIHGARGLFALMVFFFHIANSGLPAPSAITGDGPIHWILFSFEYGVELFFGISGIVIVGALDRAKGPGSFLWDRATRIYPTLWITVLIFLVLDMASGRGGHTPMQLIAALPANLLAMPPVIPVLLIHPAAWSLSYEFTFYSLCTVGLVCASRLGRWAWIGVFIVGGLLLTIHLRALMIVAGILVARKVVRGRIFSANSGVTVLAVIAFLGLWELIAHMSGGDIMKVQAYRIADVRLILIPLAFCMALIAFIGISSGVGLFGQFLRHPAMAWAGTVSYSFYLWHPIVMALIKRALLSTGAFSMAGEWSMLLFTVAALPPSLLVAWAGQNLIERRFTKWIRQSVARRGMSLRADVKSA